MKKMIKSLDYKLMVAKQGLSDIKHWDEDLEEEWGDPGERASEALKEINKKVNP
jgi:hypothetical protein